MREYLINHEELLSEWDYKKNADVDVSKVTLGSTKKYYWNCVKCGYNWSASMNNRSKGRGCPCCAGKKVWEGHNDLLTINPNLCEEWDYSKNDSLTPKMFTSGSGEKVWWKCRHCDYEWITSINHRNRGEACPCCAGKIVRKGYNDLETVCPELIKEWNWEKNSLPSDYTKSSNKKVWWKCNECGNEWIAPIFNRTKGSGCQACGRIAISAAASVRRVSETNNLRVLYPNLVNEWDYDKNNELPQNVAPVSNKTVWWKCANCGNEWPASISNRVKGRGCPECNKGRQSSLPEQIVLCFVKEFFSDAVNGYVDEKISPYSIDVYIPSIKVAIEYDGTRWHRNVKNDYKKSKVIISKGIRLIRIREEGCPSIDDGSYIILTTKPDYEKYSYLEKSLESLSNKLSELSDKHIDISRVEFADLLSKANREIYNHDLLYSLASVRPELAEEWDYEKNEGLTPFNVKPQSNKKVYWICKKCGFGWDAQVCNRFNGTGCPACAGKKIVKGYNDLETLFPDVALDWNYDLNEKAPSDYTAYSSKKVSWICNRCGSEWKSTIYNRTKVGIGCKCCKLKK